MKQNITVTAARQGFYFTMARKYYFAGLIYRAQKKKLSV